MGFGDGFNTPGTRGIPRGPVEWGRILYQPKWAGERRYKSGREVYMDGILLAMGLLLVGLGVFMMFVDTLGLMLVGIGLMIVFMGYASARSKVRRMPFRMYERGVTLTEVPFGQGWRRRETLVPYEMVERVHVESTTFQGIGIKNLKASHLGPGGETQDIDIGFEEPDNPLDVMVVFREMTPDKLDKSLDRYVGPDAVDTVIPVPFEDRGGSMRHDASGIIMPTAMMLFMAVLGGVLMGATGADPLGFLFSLVFQVIMYIVFIGMASWLTVRGFLSSVGDNVSVQGDRLVLPRSTLYRLYADTRPTLPLAEVAQVRKALDHYFFGHKAVLVTTAGERVVTRHRLFEQLKDHPWFERDGFVLENRRATRVAGRPLVSINRWKGFALALSMLLLSILVGLAMGEGGEVFFGMWDSYGVYVILAFMAIMLPIYIVARALMAKRAARGEGIMASDRGLMMPDPSGVPRWMPRTDVRSAVVKKDGLGPYIELRTVEGMDKYPLSISEKLEQAGIPVVDDLGLVQSVTITSVAGTAAVPTGPIDIGTPSSRTERPRVTGRGAQLSETPPEDLERDRRKVYVMGVVVIALSAVFGAVQWVIIPMYVGENDALCDVFMGILIVFLAAIGVLLLAMAQRVAPVCVYENGVEWYSLAKGVHYVPWGEFATAQEAEYGGSKMLMLKNESGMGGAINASLPGYDGWVEQVKERVGDPAYTTGEVRTETATRYWAIPLIAGAVSLVIGVMTGLYMNSELEGSTTGAGWTIWVLMGVPSAMIYFVVIMGWLMARNVFGFAKAKFPPAAIVAVVVVMLLVFSVALSAAGPVSFTRYVDIIESPDPGRTVLEPGDYEDQALVVDGPVTVGAGETLALINTTLTFDPAPGLRHGIWVHPEGTLLLQDAVVNSTDPEVGFTFEVHGTARIRDSRIVGTATDPDHVNGEGGLEVYNDDVVIEGTTFENALSASVMTVYCSPTIRGCTFSGAMDEGVEGHGGAPVIEDCQFVDCEWPVLYWNASTVEIVNCTFRDCPRGVGLAQCPATVRDCTFRNITEYGIRWSSECVPVREGNTFEDVGVDEEAYTSYSDLGSTCMAVTVVIAIVVLAILLLMNRKRPPITRAVDGYDAEEDRPGAF